MWIKGDTFLRIPEVEEFENDMFGGDLNEKITRMERIYATNGNEWESDQVKIQTAVLRFGIDEYFSDNDKCCTSKNDSSC